MGFKSWSETDWNNYATKKVYNKSTSEIFTSTTLKNEFDPLNVTRESRDSENHPQSTPIIIGLDVTGSMSDILKKVTEKLGLLVNEIYDKKPISDPQICFNAIGDSYCDNAPLQVTQFESDITIAEQLTKLWFEEGGGGNFLESYTLSWYFAAYHTSIDSYEKHNKKGFIFTMGDDGIPPYLTKEEIHKVFGDTIETDTISAEELLSIVNRKWEVYHFMIDMRNRCGNADKRIDKWREVLGERAIYVTDYSKIPELIVSILELNNGKSIDEVSSNWSGDTSLIVKTSLGNLATTDTNNKGKNSIIEF